MSGAAGILANPASGRDIRRLVAHASVFDNDEKASIVRRVIVGLAAAGVRRLLYMPDPYRLVERALDGVRAPLLAEPVPGRFFGRPDDTTIAARAMADAGARVLISLGGDGTNRALALGSCAVPLIPLSTGTNNVFPFAMEGTIAGLAAGAIATGVVEAAQVARPCKRVRVCRADGSETLALIDAALMGGSFLGARAVWEMDSVREAVVTRALSSAIGLSALAGMTETLTADEDAGMHVVLARPGERAARVVRAAIAPGRVEDVGLARVERLPLGSIVRVAGPGLVALDGEREFRLAAGEEAAFSVDRGGPPVVDVARCLDAARAGGSPATGTGE